jgi:hypothetical protein
MGKIIAVLGLGSSVNLFDPADFDLSVGVNDIWRIFPADIVVCVDKPQAFTPERMRTIAGCKPQAFYSQAVIWDQRLDFHKIDLLPGYPDNICRLDQPAYYKSFCSPFVAVQIAYKLYAATEIHLFGVDLVNHPHLDRALCARIKIHFRNLNQALKDKGCAMIVHGEGILTDQL